MKWKKDSALYVYVCVRAGYKGKDFAVRLAAAEHENELLYFYAPR